MIEMRRFSCGCFAFQLIYRACSGNPGVGSFLKGAYCNLQAVNYRSEETKNLVGVDCRNVILKVCERKINSSLFLWAFLIGLLLILYFSPDFSRLLINT